jgi:hypothetical protein
VVYKDLVLLDDLLVFGRVAPLGEQIAKFEGQDVPRLSLTNFYFKHKGSTWNVRLMIEIANGTPNLMSVQTFGPGGINLWVLEKLKSKTPWTKSETSRLNREISETGAATDISSVRRFQLDMTATYSKQLFARALLMLLEEAGTPYNALELKALTRKLSNKVKREKVTDALLKDVANLYLNAIELNEPVYEAIMDKYKVGYRRAQEFAQFAREHPSGYLPSTTQGKKSKKNRPMKRKGK